MFFFVSTTWTSASFSLRVHNNRAIVFALITLARRHLRERPPAFNYINCYHTEKIIFIQFIVIHFGSCTYYLCHQLSQWTHAHTVCLFFSFPCKNLILNVNGKTTVPTNITNKTSKGILAVVRCIRGTGYSNSNSDKLYLNKVITSVQKPVTVGVKLPVETCKLKSFK